MVEDEDKGVRRVNRPRWEGGGMRYVRKLLQKKNWFKNRGGNRQEESRDQGSNWKVEGPSKQVDTGRGEEGEPETVIFVPSTPRGELMKAMREADIEFRRGTKRYLKVPTDCPTNSI